jgi:hypothetical protein
MAGTSALLLFACLTLYGHDLITTKLTWSREISRLMGEKCAGCHREGGSSFPLTTYREARPWAKAIKEQVLERQMPPFGAVKGFADLRGDDSLTQEQIGLISAWVEGGAPEGDPALLPQERLASPKQTPAEVTTGPSIRVTGSKVLNRALTIAGVKGAGIQEGNSIRAVAQDPNGAVTPLVWIYRFRKQFDRAYYFRRPLTLTAGTKIITSPGEAGSIELLQSNARKAEARASERHTTAADEYLSQSSAGGGALDYVCPMDPDVRSDKAGKCLRCGMALKLGIPDGSEYGIELNAPAHLVPGETADLRFRFLHPRTGSTVRRFEIMHEKLFHLFVVSSDLQYFQHVHPTPRADGSFSVRQSFPRAGMYRIVADIYPVGGTPQLLSRTLFVTSGPNGTVSLAGAKLDPDERLQHGENTDVQLVAGDSKPVAGTKTHLTFRFSSAEGMQMYLGAWAHMFISSDDTMDVLHVHPAVATGGREIQFDVIFPRARTYRAWIQFQRANVLNTVAVNIPVATIEQAFASTRSR